MKSSHAYKGYVCVVIYKILARHHYQEKPGSIMSVGAPQGRELLTP